MTARRSSRDLIATALAVVLMMLPVLPAFGGEPEPPAAPVISADVTVGSVSVAGLDAEQARTALLDRFASAPFGSLPIVMAGKVYSLESSQALSFDVDGLVAEAFAASGTVTLAPRYSVVATAVSGLVSTMASRAYLKAVDAKRTIVKRRLKVKAAVAGARLDQAATRAAISAALLQASTAASSSTAATLTIKPAGVRAKVTAGRIGKTIVVSLRERLVLLYSGTRLEKKYRCAIGMRSNPTPTGVFKIIARSSAPAWRNPGSGWAKGMPAYIAPGPTNPLGLRALYLNSPGIRIHGTHKSWSIGTAASHGCIRLKNSDVVNIYPRVPVGTPVYILK